MPGFGYRVPLARPSLSQGCGTRRFPTLIAAQTAADRGAQGTPEGCPRGGILHWHLVTPLGEPYIALAIRRLVLLRDGYACVCCGNSIISQPYTILRRLRSPVGGSNGLENLITALGSGHEGCGGRISAYRDAADAAKGYRLRPGQDQAEIPVAYAMPGGLEWFILNPDGSRTASEGPGASVPAAGLPGAGTET